MDDVSHLNMSPLFRKKTSGFKREVSEPLRRLVLAPVDMEISVDKDFIRVVREKLLKLKEPLGKGRYVSLQLLGHEMSFYILDSEPMEGLLTEDTEITVLPRLPSRLKGDKYQFEFLILKPSDSLIIYEGDHIMKSEVVEDKLKLYILRYQGKASITDIMETH